MKKSADILNSVTALFLTISVINIYVTDSYCSFTKDAEHACSFIATSEYEPHEHHANPVDHHDHVHGIAEKDHHAEDGKEDNCCKDNSGAFFSSLFNPALHFVLVKSPVSSLFNKSETFTGLFIINNFSSTSEYFLFKPPPKIPDIRVFIHSFII